MEEHIRKHTRQLGFVMSISNFDRRSATFVCLVSCPNGTALGDGGPSNTREWCNALPIVVIKWPGCQKVQISLPVQKNDQSEDMLKVQQAAAPLLNIIHYMCPACDSENEEIWGEIFGEISQESKPLPAFGTNPKIRLISVKWLINRQLSRNLPVDTLERLEVNREMLSLGFIAQSQVLPASNQQNWVGERTVDSRFY